MADSVKVAVRVRPLNTREVNANSRCIVEMDGPQTTIVNPASDDKKSFTFDHSYWSMDKDDSRYASQDTLMKDIGDSLIANAWKGYNCSIFAYGQTGSGKSYSMMGTKEDTGIIPRICDAIFAEMAVKKSGAEKLAAETGETITYKVEATYLEIYNEKVKDLLNPAAKPGLKVRENPQMGVYVEDLQSFLVNSFQDMDDLIERGQKTRSVASTQMNATSSRSHSVFTIVFTQTKVNKETLSANDITSKINLVDLAGSERQASTGATGDRLKEGCAINKSLSALGNVISALAESATAGKKKFIPYRDSVLTRLLQQSLGGNAKTVMIAALSPADINYDETLSTLRYADRAKKIKNNAVINESPNEKLIRELRAEVARLKALLEAGGGTGDLEMTNKLLDERNKMKEELEAQQKLVAMLTMSSEERLKNQESIASADQTATGDLNKPHLVNLHEDPMLSEKVIVRLDRDATLFGKKKGDVKPDYELRGLNVEAEHARISNNNDVLTIESMSKTHTFVNGAVCNEPCTLKDQDRIIFGNNYVFRVVNPADPVTVPEGTVYDFEYARQEQVEASGMMTLLSEEEAAKEATKKIKAAEDEMRAKQEEQEKKLAAEREALEASLAAADAEAQAELKKRQDEIEAQALKLQETLRKEREKFETQKRAHQQKILLEEQLVSVLRMISEANGIAKALEEPVVFESKLLTGVNSGGSQYTHVGVCMHNKETSIKVIWDLPKFTDRLYRMREVFEEWQIHDENGEEYILAREVDPFYDPPEDTLIGRAQIFLESLAFGIEVDDTVTIMDHHANKCGELAIEIIPTYPALDEEALDDFVEDSEELLGREAVYIIKVKNAIGLPADTAAGVYVKYNFYRQGEVTARAVGTKTANPKFDHEEKIDIGYIGNTFLDYMTEDSLVFAVYGHPDRPELLASPAQRVVGSPRPSVLASSLASQAKANAAQSSPLATPTTPVAFGSDDKPTSPPATAQVIPKLDISEADDGSDSDKKGGDIEKSKSDVNIAELSTRVEDLEATNMKMSKSMLDLSEEAKRLQEENEDLKTARTNTSNVVTENEALREKIQQLEQDLQAKNSTVTKLEEDVKALETKNKQKSSACVIS